ncbi:MAG: hypothetical protein WKG32_04705 [Gemmatimonadaceae bacterium]
MISRAQWRPVRRLLLSGGVLRRVLAMAALVVLSAAGCGAQALVPNGRWRTIRTAHFDVHFTPDVEETARRAAAAAERAYSLLSAELRPPRGRVDLVVADNVDYTNGFATPVPSNRIVIYAQPPVSVLSLRFYDDWTALVVSHELTHIFHLDRARGIWGAAQRIFGRSPWLMPNLYAPAWLTEGLATYFESRVTNAGRVQGTHERMIVRASMLEGALPGLGDLSGATSRYPGGEIPYVYGSLFVDFLARTHGPAGIGRLVERTSGALLPFSYNRQARRSLGISFNRAWREWRDSLRADSGAAALASPGWRDLTREGRLALFPRWTDSSTLLFAASNGRETPAAYRVSTSGQGSARRLSRRNGVDANSPLVAGGLLFAQLEFEDPYRIRSDLYVERDGRVRRLTHAARLAEPDARADGEIVAVRGSAGTNSLVRVAADGRRIAPITGVSPDTQWAEPRWSPRGDLIAATRWTRGGYADIVVLDSLGRLLAELTHDRAVDASPSWMPDGSGVLFSSDRTGTTDIYFAPVATVPASRVVPPRRVTRAATGLFNPAVAPDGRSLAAVRFGADGWRVGITPLDTIDADMPAASPDLDAAPLPPAERAAGRSRAFSPWRTLRPYSWAPLLGETASGGTSFGAATNGRDVIGRHSYVIEALADPRRHDHEGYVTYRYAGLGQPVLDLDIEQDWQRLTVVDTAHRPVGVLRRRARAAGLSATLSRPRVRTSSYVTLGAELEAREYVTEPAPLLGKLDAFFRGAPRYRALVGSAGWSNTQRPALAISPEDGISVGAGTRVRWLTGEAGVYSRSTTAGVTLYKSLDLPGFAHHVLAARLAGGYADGPAAGEFGVGGTSGTPLSVVPGLTLGERRTFGVRGFPADARTGRRALVTSVEYRAPLARVGRGYNLWPVFLDRTSVALFGDAGTADDARIGEPFRGAAWLVSAGAELNLDAALQYDVPYRFRLGVAVPVRDGSLTGAKRLTVYARAGASF